MSTFNGEQTIDQAIQSICQQSFIDWEMIICDDCSDDGTYRKILKWEKRDKRIKVIRNKENKKLAFSLNRCLQYAEGEYIARMDDDDVSYPERLQCQIDFLENNKEFAFVSSIVDCYYDEKKIPNYFIRKNQPNKEDFLKGSQFVHPATMFRKKVLQEVGGYWDSLFNSRTEDYELFMRLYAKGYKGFNIQIPLLKYSLSESRSWLRQYKYRIFEVYIRYRGFKQLNLLPKGILYIIKPLFSGIIPKKIVWKLYLKKYGKQ